MSEMPQNFGTGQLQKTSRRPAGTEMAALLVLLVVLGLFGIGYSWLFRQWATPQTVAADQINPQSGLSLKDAEAVVLRGSTLIGLDQPAKIWIERLAAGRASLADYLLRVFVSPAYLSQKADDEAFLDDLSQVLTGAPLADEARAAAVALLAGKDSRLVYIDEYLQSLGYAAKLVLPDDPTRLRTLAVAKDRPPAGEEVIGLLPVNSEVRLTGPAARFRLYSDGRLCQALQALAADPAILNNYTIEWDTRQENPGSHQLTLLIQTSDGRGSWVDLADYIVPEVIPLKTGLIKSGELTRTKASWYELPAQGSEALLTILDAKSPIKLELFDLSATLLTQTTTVADQPAALRHRFASAAVASGTLYVKVEADSASKDTNNSAIHYKLMPALAAAIPDKDSGRLLGVLAYRDKQVLISDESGVQSWEAAEDFTLIDPTARLAKLELALPDGQIARIASPFDPDTLAYGLYVEEQTSDLTLSALTMEGSSATLQIERLTEDGASLILKPNEKIPLEKSENRLRLLVTGFDGTQKTYEVNILRPPHQDGYDQTLADFPISYRSALWLLHLQHTAWEFTADEEGLSWPEFIAAQDEKDRSLVDANDSPASWVEPGSPVYDGASWKAADLKVIEYFADPRNFLDSINVFQFENLLFDPDSQTLAGIGKILEGSFMADGNSQNVDYASLLLKAGEQADISPYFLAAKIIQEMGRQGESPLATGSLDGYEGVYNFYNIGSTPNPEVVNGAVINGARFALYGREADLGEITPEEKAWLLPWRSPSDAIIGGAVWIADRYVKAGQNTLYLQKFDLVEAGGLYTHQYAQNIQMAWAEGRRTRSAYAGLDLLDEAFIFKIPIFTNMPDQPQTLP